MMNWAEAADLLEAIESRCREILDMAGPLGDLELGARLMLVAARVTELEEKLAANPERFADTATDSC